MCHPDRFDFVSTLEEYFPLLPHCHKTLAILLRLGKDW